MAIDTGLINLFNGFIAGTGGLVDWDLYTLTLTSGLTLRFAAADFDIVGVSSSVLVNGYTYPSSTVRVNDAASKVQAHWKVGLDTDEWTVVFLPRSSDVVTGATYPDTIGNVAWVQAAQGGALDAADFQVDRAYFSAAPMWPIPPAGVACVSSKTVFAGRVAEVDCSTTAVSIKVEDYRSLFSYQMPRNFWQAQCRHTLFDAGCNANGNMQEASFGVNAIVAPGSTQATIIGQGLAVPQGSRTYVLGKVLMTSGMNQGRRAFIVNWDGAFTLSLINPLPFPLAIGDSFTAYPGCDKQYLTCQAFNNAAQFGGFPWIPNPEAAS